jgi:hypothetical protein
MIVFSETTFVADWIGGSTWLKKSYRTSDNKSLLWLVDSVDFFSMKLLPLTLRALHNVQILFFRIYFQKKKKMRLN